MGRSKNPTFDIVHQGIARPTVLLAKDNQQH